MALLGTTTSDPDFYSRKIGALGDTMRGFIGVMEQRKAKKQEKQKQEIETFLAAASANPELASTWGQDLKTRLGKDNPELAPLVDLLANRHQKLAEVDQAGQAWTGGWDKIDQDYRAKQAAAQAMPDQMAIPNPFGGIFAEIPNPQKQTAQQELAARDPQQFGLEALGQLTPSQRLAAQVWAKSKGYEMPKAPSQFDPYGDDLPEWARMGYAVQQGKVGGELADAWRYDRELQSSPADQEYRQFQENTATVKDKNERERLTQQHNQNLEKLTETERLAKLRQERHFSGMAGLENLRASNNPRAAAAAPSDIGGKGGINWKSFQAEHKAVVEDFDSRRRTHLGLEADATKKDRANEEFVKNNGRRPAPLTESYARRMQKTLKEKVAAGEVSEADATAEMSRMVQEWTSLTSHGATPEAAIRRISGAAEPDPAVAPTPDRKIDPGGPATRILKDRVVAAAKDAEAKSWAAEAFEAGIAQGGDPREVFKEITALLRTRKSGK
jgi:hypothetical protein